MAQFCLLTGFRPADYWAMTIEEVSTFIELLEERHRL
jgi:hypothetical protein